MMVHAYKFVIMGQYIKSTCSPIVVGCTLLQVDGVTPVADGYYSDGTTWWQVSGEAGLIVDSGLCSGGTTTTTTTTTLAPVCYTYINEGASTWIGDYQACDGTWYYSSPVNIGSTICAVDGTPFTISGTNLTKGDSCTV